MSRTRDKRRLRLTNFLHVPTDLIEEDELRKKLLFFNPLAAANMYGGNKKNVDPYYSLFYGYDEDGNYLVPRTMFPEYPRDDSFVHYIMDSVRLPHGNFKHPPLYPHQKEAFRALVSADPNHGKSVISGCGSGKTIIAFAYMRWISCRTIIIVDTAVLRDQWINELVTHCRVHMENIGIVQDRKFEVGKQFHVTIAMLQTLRNRALTDRFWRNFGLTIYEEGHQFGAETYAKVMPQSLGKRLLLTATYNRQDQKDKVYRLHVGDPCYKNLDTPHVPDIWVYPTGLSFMRTNLGAQIRRFEPFGNFQRENVKSRMARSLPRNKRLIELLDRAYVAGREILFLSDRIQQLRFLYEHFKSKAYDCAMILGKAHGGMSAEEAKNYRMIFAIKHICDKGFNKRSLDILFEGLFYTSPNSIQQRFGRILRSYDGKKKPIVVLFEDDDELFVKQTKKMVQTAKRLWPELKVRRFQG